MSTETQNHQHQLEQDAEALRDDEDLTTREVLKVREISQDIERKMVDANFDVKVLKDYKKRLVASESDMREVNQIKKEVEIDLGFVDTLRAHTGIDQKTDVQTQILRYFSEPQEKRKKLRAGLPKHLKDLDDLFTRIMKVAPEKAKDFRKLSEGKREFVRGLETSAKNEIAYAKLLKEHSDEMNATERAAALRHFKSANPDEQKNLLDEKNFANTLKQKSTNKLHFDLYPANIKREHRDAVNNPKTNEADRVIALQGMENALTRQHQQALENDPNARHFSPEEKQMARAEWKKLAYIFQLVSKRGDSAEMKKVMETRIAMVEGLPKQLKNMKEVYSDKYEEESSAVKLEVQKMFGFTDYYSLVFDEKDQVKKAMKEINERRDGEDDQYEGALDNAVSEKFMSPDTKSEFMKIFKGLSQEERNDWMKGMKSPDDTKSELGKRIAVTNDYKALIEEKHEDNLSKQQELLGAFYQMGYTERRLIFLALKHEKTEAEAATEDGSESTETSTATGPKSAEAKNSKEQRNVSDAKLVSALEKVKSNPNVKKSIAETYLASETIRHVRTSERLNEGATKIEDKKGHLDNAAEAELSAKLSQITGGKKKVGRDHTAQETSTLNVQMMNVADRGKLNALKEDVVAHEGSRAQEGMDNVQLKDQDGRTQSAEIAEQQLDGMKATLKDQLFAKTVMMLSGQGLTLAPADIKALQEIIAKDELKINLRETAMAA